MPLPSREILFAEGDRLKSARWKGKFATVLALKPDDRIPVFGFIKLAVYREKDGGVTEPMTEWVNPVFMGEWVKDSSLSDDSSTPPPTRYDPPPFQSKLRRDR